MRKWQLTTWLSLSSSPSETSFRDKIKYVLSNFHYIKIYNIDPLFFVKRHQKRNKAVEGFSIIIHCHRFSWKNKNRFFLIIRDVRWVDTLCWCIMRLHQLLFGQPKIRRNEVRFRYMFFYRKSATIVKKPKRYWSYNKVWPLHWVYKCLNGNWQLDFIT